MSTTRRAIINTPNNNKVIKISSYYKHSLLVFEDIMNSYTTTRRFEDVIKRLETQHYKKFGENDSLQYINTARSTYVFEKMIHIKDQFQQRCLFMTIRKQWN